MSPGSEPAGQMKGDPGLDAKSILMTLHDEISP